MSQRLQRWAFPVWLLLLVLAAGGGGWWYLSSALSQGGQGGIGGPFTLTDSGGRSVTDRDFRGHYLLVYFGYTFCPDVCPTTLNEIAGALDKLPPSIASQIQPLFITIDPQRDTPKAVGDYVSAFSRRIVGLTGTPDQIAGVARAYRVYYAPQHTSVGADYTVDHSSILYLMDRSGNFVAAIRADQTAEQMAAEIAGHLS